MKAAQSSTRSPRSVLFGALAALCAGIGLGAVIGFTRPGDPNGMRPGTARETGPLVTLPQAIAATPVGGPAASPIRTESEAAQTLARLRSELDPIRRREGINALCASLDARGAQVLAAALGPRFVQPFEFEIRDTLMSRWAELDPRSAAEFVMQHDDVRRLNSLYAIMRTWAASDLAGAQAWALQPREREAHQAAINAIVGFMAASDPRAAMAFLDELPAAENKSFYMIGLCQELAQRDIAAAVELAAQLPSQNLRDNAVRFVATVWGRREPGKAVAWLLQNTAQGDDRDWQTTDLTNNLLRQWVRASPEEAVAFADDQPPGALRNELIASMGGSWGAVDPKAAAGWLATLPKSVESSGAFNQLILSWTQSDPSAAGSFLLTQPAERRRDSQLATLGDVWARQDPAAALAWAQGQSGPEVERFVAAPALGKLAADDLAHVDRYLSQVTTPAARSALIAAAGIKLAEDDPAQAAPWVMQMAPEVDFDRAIALPIAMWLSRNAAAAGAWLKAQPAGSRRDAAVDVFASHLATNDGAGAATWANSIGDEKMRTERIRYVVDEWGAKDPAAARAWVMKQKFPAERQQQLLKNLSGFEGK